MLIKYEIYLNDSCRVTLCIKWFSIFIIVRGCPQRIFLTQVFICWEILLKKDWDIDQNESLFWKMEVHNWSVDGQHRNWEGGKALMSWSHVMWTIIYRFIFVVVVFLGQTEWCSEVTPGPHSKTIPGIVGVPNGRLQLESRSPTYKTNALPTLLSLQSQSTNFTIYQL